MTTSFRDITLLNTILSSYVNLNNLSFHCVSPNLAFINFNVSFTGVALPTGTTTLYVLTITGWSFLHLTGEKHFLNSNTSYHMTISSGVLCIVFDSTATQILNETIDILEHIILDNTLKANIPNYSLMF